MGTPKEINPLKADFRNYLFYVWQHLGLPPPTDVQFDIAWWLQHGPRRGVIEAFRGVGKSWITAAYVTWLLYNDVDHKVMVVSASKPKADEFSTFTKRLINELPILSHLRARDGDRESNVAFDVHGCRPDPSPSVKSVGITGQITGSRADTIIPDDIEIPHNSDTQGKRERIAELIKEFDAVVKPGGRILYLGTPQTEQSIYNLLPDRGYVIRVWPARVPADTTRYGTRLAPYILKIMESGQAVGSSTDPKRFSDEDLVSRELSYGKSGFQLQFMLDTTISDADRHPLKVADLIVYPVDGWRGPTDLVWASDPANVRNDLPCVALPGDRFHKPAWVCGDFAEFSTTVMFVDPSGRGRDETAYAVVKELHGRLYLVASGGYRGGGYDDAVLVGLCEVAKKHNVKLILVEPNYGGGMFTKMLQGVTKRVYPCGVEDAKWSQVAKEARIIDVLEPVMNQHRLVVDPRVIEEDYRSIEGETDYQYRLIYQLTRLTPDRGSLAYDDRIDALAGAVAYFQESMAKDSEELALRRKDDLLDEQLRGFLKNALGATWTRRGGSAARLSGGSRYKGR